VEKGTWYWRVQAGVSEVCHLPSAVVEEGTSDGGTNKADPLGADAIEPTA
jgi:hypothetical protein